MREGGRGSGLLHRKTEETECGRHLRVEEWGCWELGDEKIDVLVSWCALVRFAECSVRVERYGTDVWEKGDESV